MAKNYRVIQIKLNQLVYENVHMIADLGPTSKTYLSTITVSNIYQSFYLQDGGKNQLHRYRTELRHCHAMYTLQQRDVAHSCTPPPRTVSQLATMNGNRIGQWRRQDFVKGRSEVWVYRGSRVRSSPEAWHIYCSA